MRLTIQQALDKGLITQDTARELGGRGARTDRLRRRRARAHADDAPQALLQALLTRHWPSEAYAEYRGAVPGRRFRLDVGFPRYRIAVECDGWEHHGRYLADFKRDRERDRALLLSGWRICRFYASEIREEPDAVVDMVRQLIAITPPAPESR